MPELLFEIGCEEMPARFVVPAMTDLAALASQMLGKEGLLPEGSTPDQVRTAGTPRRLTLMVQGLAERQPDRQETALGPPLKAAYDKDGAPTKAALGFAKSQGVEVDQLSQAETEKGPRLAYVKHLPGQPASQVLAELLPRLAQALHFAKTMRWGELEFRFARPIHWLLALLDGQVLPFELAGIKSGGLTRGHRFMSPDPIQVSGVDDYLAQLEAASVIVDRAQRRHLTAMEVETTAQVAQGRLVDDPALLEEVTDLVELPVACCGTFDQEFLEVPRAVIISAMRGHQRYFALEDSAGNLLPNFIAVNNTKPRDLAVVTRGHEKVLRARLSDARFFLTEDTKEPLATRLQELERVTYHAKLGTSRQKVERFSALAGWLAEQLAPELKDLVLRAAALAKCDLVTEMVGEFPDLQGVVGEEYARRDGEDPQVAVAIREHYMPVGAEAPLPQGMVGTLVWHRRPPGHHLRLLWHQPAPQRGGRSLCPAPGRHRGDPPGAGKEPAPLPGSDPGPGPGRPGPLAQGRPGPGQGTGAPFPGRAPHRHAGRTGRAGRCGRGGAGGGF